MGRPLGSKNKKTTELALVNTGLELDMAAIERRAALVATETDVQIIDRLRNRFSVLDMMTKAVKAGDVRAMIVSGPAGVGKSFGVEAILSASSAYSMVAQKPRFQIVKGAISAVSLYIKLHEFSDAGSVLVFDDTDDIFYDQQSLNILKAALDSNETRIISWNTDSKLLRNGDIPNRFEFKGSVIFISNLNFAMVKSKALKVHLDALQSRCHYISLDMDTTREKLLRISQIVSDGLLSSYEFSWHVEEELLAFIHEYQSVLREVSLRTILKAADLVKAFPHSWRELAKVTLIA